MQEMPHEDMILRNAETKISKTIHLDPGFYDSPEQIRVILGGEEFKLLSTKSPEQIRIENAITTFGTKEFTKLAKEYPQYGTSSQYMTLPPDLGSKILRLLERPCYKTLRRAVHKNQEVLDHIIRTFVCYISTTRTVDALVEEAKSRRLDDVYLFDYTKRNMKLLEILTDREHPHQKKELQEVFESISKDVEMDDRRPIGVEQLLNAMSTLTTTLARHKTQLEQYPKESMLYENPNQDEALTALWEDLYQASCSTKTSLETFLLECQKKSEQFAQMTEDKLHYHTTRILGLHKWFVERFQMIFTKSKESQEANNLAQEQFVSELKKYTSDVSIWGCDFVCDRRALSPFLTKMLELQYDTVFYYLESRSKDEQWILHLVETISTHIPYLEKALKGELPQQKIN